MCVCIEYKFQSGWFKYVVSVYADLLLLLTVVLFNIFIKYNK